MSAGHAGGGRGAQAEHLPAPAEDGQQCSQHPVRVWHGKGKPCLPSILHTIINEKEDPGVAAADQLACKACCMTASQRGGVFQLPLLGEGGPCRESRLCWLGYGAGQLMYHIKPALMVPQGPGVFAGSLWQVPDVFSELGQQSSASYNITCGPSPGSYANLKLGLELVFYVAPPVAPTW